MYAQHPFPSALRKNAGLDTPLRDAARWGRGDALRVLLAADLGVRDTSGMTPLGMAKMMHNEDVASFLGQAMSSEVGSPAS
jgi:hypothetical protein